MVKVNVKNRLHGHELDLSLLSLEDVPVKDIAELPKATHLDLSSNKIKVIPHTLCSLTYIVKLDLSKNFIRALPNNFGDLTKLQYLDISGNQILTLPVSFYQLKSLRWLDLKDNPLNTHLKQIAGDCLDKKQCMSCAKEVVQFMDGVNDQLLQQEYERNLRLEVPAPPKLKVQPRAPKVAKKTSAPVVNRIKVAKSDCFDPKNAVPKESSSDSLKLNGQHKKMESKHLESKAQSVGYSPLQKTFILFFLLVSLFFGALSIYVGGEFTSDKIAEALKLMKTDFIHVSCRLRTLIWKIVQWIGLDGWFLTKFVLKESASLLWDVWEIMTMVVDHLYDVCREYIFS